MGPHLHLWCYFYALHASRPLSSIIKERLEGRRRVNISLPGVVAVRLHPPATGRPAAHQPPLIGRQCRDVMPASAKRIRGLSLVASVYADSAQSGRTWSERYNKLLNTSEHYYKIFASCFCRAAQVELAFALYSQPARFNDITSSLVCW